ncbi:MAG: Gfo/Idh/MocA family oxidoreductase [Planctomycetes bacterium]|nr:Gfo/Idh/MocA family oxidoreductase [Planctomycetota bacterium]
MTTHVIVLGLSHDHVWTNLEALAAQPDTGIVAAFDSHERLRERFSSTYSRPAFETPEALFSKFEADAAYVFSSNSEGAELAILAAERGLHVLVEKPMAATLAQADAMLAAAKDNNVRLVVNWPFAWWPQMQHALRLAQDGTIGRVWNVKYRAAHAGPKELGCSDEFCEWLFDPLLNGGGGALMDYSCYGACLARVLLGVPTSVTSLMGNFCKDSISVEDNALIAMKYPQGMATAEASWTQIGKLTSYTTAIYGTEGTLVVEPRDGGGLLLATKADPEGSPVDVPEPAPHLRDSAAHFLHAIAGGGNLMPLCAAETCRDAQEILEAGLIAARDGREFVLRRSGSA